MTEQQPQRAVAAGAGAGDELALADREYVRTYDASELNPARRAHDEDHVEQTRPQREHDAHGEQDVGDGEEHVHDPHDERIGAPPEEAGEQAERHADQRRQRHRGEADAERDAAAVQDAAEDVAAEVIGAQRVLTQAARLPHRWPQALGEHLPGRIPRSELRREHRGSADQQQSAEAERGAEADAPARARDDRKHGGGDAHRALRT